MVMLDFFHLFVKLFKVSGFTLPVNLKSRNSGQHLFYADVAKHDLRKIEQFHNFIHSIIKILYRSFKKNECSPELPSYVSVLPHPHVLYIFHRIEKYDFYRNNL